MKKKATLPAVKELSSKQKKRRALLRTLIFCAVFAAVFCLFAIPMGLANAMNTLMNTAYRLLMDTTFYILAVAVLAGAVSALLTEYGVVDLLNRLLSPLMKPLFGMPGAAALGMVTTYFSDNPAILTLADDKKYRRYFKAYQVPALTNLGTSFGMGLIVTTLILGIGDKAGPQVGIAALCGNLGAVIGGILSTRLMMHFTGKALGRTADAVMEDDAVNLPAEAEKEPKKHFINILMDGGKKGVELGLGIIPGVIIICTFVMMLTNGAPDGGVYTGGAYEGIGLLPMLAEKIDFILKPLFGFSSAADIAVPVTALGSAGAALGVIPELVKEGLANCNDLAVFTAMCMCWSGYLSTHVSMMDVLHCSEFTGKAIFCHTLGGLLAGSSAHWLFVLIPALL